MLCTVHEIWFLDFDGDQIINDVSIDDMDDTSICSWKGYKLVGDNLDKNVKPRYRRIDQKTQSLHFFHYYAVQDRIDLSNVPDEPNPCLQKAVSDLDVATLLPSDSDHQAMIYNFGILVSRVLVEEIPFFSNTFDDVIMKHIQHPHIDAMNKKSKTVSL